MKNIFVLVVLVFFCAKGLCEEKLYKAVTSGDIKVIGEMVAANPEIVNNEIEFRGFPLSVAAAVGKDEVIKFLLAKGAKKTNVDKKTGNSALHELVTSSAGMTEAKLVTWKKCVAVFKENGFDFNLKNKLGETPIMFASYVNVNNKSLSFNVDFLKCLMENGAKLEKNDGLLDWMFKNALPPGAKPADADWSRLEFAKAFIELGADVNSADKETKITPLITLLGTTIPDEQKEDIVKTLIEYGASINAKSKDGKKPVTMVTDKKSKLYEVLRKTKKIDKPVGKATGKPVGKPADKPSDKPADKPVDKKP